MSSDDTEAKVFLFEDIRNGQSTSFTKTITQEMVDAFAALTGDHNPLHVDVSYARELGHPSPVVFGLLTASLYSRLVGMHLPGKFSLLHQVDVSFKSPVYVGDLLTVTGEVSDVHESVRQIEIKAAIYNQDMKKVSVGKIKVGMYA